MKNELIKWAQLLDSYSRAGLTYNTDLSNMKRYEAIKKIAEEMLTYFEENYEKIEVKL